VISNPHASDETNSNLTNACSFHANSKRQAGWWTTNSWCNNLKESEDNTTSSRHNEHQIFPFKNKSKLCSGSKVCLHNYTFTTLSLKYQQYQIQ